MVGSLNTAIAKSTHEQGRREAGFADALILVCEAYSSLGRYFDFINFKKQKA